MSMMKELSMVLDELVTCAENIESGVLIEDKVFIQRLYTEFFDTVRDASLSYYDIIHFNFLPPMILILSPL